MITDQLVPLTLECPWRTLLMSHPGRDPPGAGRPAIPRILEDEAVVELSRKHGKTPAQILIRHLVQLGFVVIPKSVKQVCSIKKLLI